MKAQGIFSRMDVLSSHYKEVEDHTSRPKLGEARPQDHASPPTIVVGCHHPFGQRCLKGRERSCRAKPHLRLRQKVFLCWLRKRCLSAWISASEHTSRASSRWLCSPAISVLNSVPRCPLTILMRGSARSSTEFNLLCHSRSSRRWLNAIDTSL